MEGEERKAAVKDKQKFLSDDGKLVFNLAFLQKAHSCQRRRLWQGLGQRPNIISFYELPQPTPALIFAGKPLRNSFAGLRAYTYCEMILLLAQA